MSGGLTTIARWGLVVSLTPENTTTIITIFGGSNKNGIMKKDLTIILRDNLTEGTLITIFIL
jgi:hypothetical protein